MSEELPFRDILWHRKAAVAVLFNLIAALPLAAQETGTFVDRLAPNDLRVVSYNIYLDSIFPETNAVRAAKFARVVNALDPDIINLQEVYSHTGANVAALMNSIMPLDGGATWYAHRAGDNVIVSKYPMSFHKSNTIPASPRSIAIALVNLPDAQYQTDFYLMNNHFRCCGEFPGGPEDVERQQQADALVSWMRDARTPGGFINLPANTPMAAVGDFNIVGLHDPLNNLLSGNIVNNAIYGADSPPDWDGSSLADLHPLHNGTGPADYTWRDDTSSFAPGRLDYMVYTNSVARVANNFVLNTVDMSASDLAATGLQTYDVTINALTYDHLPLVADFRFPAVPEPNSNLLVLIAGLAAGRLRCVRHKAKCRPPTRIVRWSKR